MNLIFSFEEFLDYTAEEREKWERWFADKPASIYGARVQAEGNFPTVWRLMDHIFTVELRHTQRLTKETPMVETTGVPEPDVAAMFAFGRAARERFRSAFGSLSEADANTPRDFPKLPEPGTVTARKLAFHTMMHEVRHWAQIATAVRNAGFPPPGKHDLVFSRALQ
jgi:uncharacterized damage-inducible protein DinB